MSTSVLRRLRTPILLQCAYFIMQLIGWSHAFSEIWRDILQTWDHQRLVLGGLQLSPSQATFDSKQCPMKSFLQTHNLSLHCAQFCRQMIIRHKNMNTTFTRIDLLELSTLSRASSHRRRCWGKDSWLRPSIASIQSTTMLAYDVPDLVPCVADSLNLRDARKITSDFCW